MFLFTSLSSSFLQHVCDITSLRCSLNTCLGLFCQITQRDITVCPIKPYKRPVISVVARFEICFSCYPFFLNHTITSETVPRRKFSVSAKYYNVHACPLFFIDLIICFTFGYNSLLISVIFITACKQSPIIAGDVCHVFVVAYVCVRTNNLIVENIFMHKIDSSVTDSHLVFSDCKQRFCSD